VALVASHRLGPIIRNSHCVAQASIISGVISISGGLRAASGGDIAFRQPHLPVNPTNRDAYHFTGVSFFTLAARAFAPNSPSMAEWSVRHKQESSMNKSVIFTVTLAMALLIVTGAISPSRAATTSIKCKNGNIVTVSTGSSSGTCFKTVTDTGTLIHCKDGSSDSVGQCKNGKASCSDTVGSASCTITRKSVLHGQGGGTWNTNKGTWNTNKGTWTPNTGAKFNQAR
jgi:hypothetical protein